jgi:hypothetical protein
MRKSIFTSMFFLPVIIILLVGIGISFARLSHRETFTTRVLDKERIVKSSGESSDSYYLIFTEAGAYKLEDEFWYGNFNSSDLYGKIHRDSTYEFTTVGWRVGFLSWYPNIVEFK